MSTSDNTNDRPLKASEWTPFQMAAFDKPAMAAKPANTSTPSGPAPDPSKLRQEIQKLREVAQTRGQAEGYTAGHAQGLAMGLKEGNEQGHAEGYAAGLEAGHKAGNEQARQATEQLLTLADECAASIASIEQEMGQALISLSIRIAEQVLRSTLDQQPEKILDLIRDITHIDGEKDAILKLRLNPADIDLVQKYLQQEPSIGQWRLSPDPAIERGGCVAETSLGDIDATLQTRWARVIASLGHKTTPGKGK